ncbi:MAG TPA: DUF421 domain-containing protein [Bacillota bacterium]|nr:DUF421 domain-containing protein [Bacillota bacterium]HOL10113.1 DUF421 domain-containing protein [Bacillota bacterium]HPO97891.1 DUF421 domain-containing protein [Bacillota bacterium]
MLILPVRTIILYLLVVIVIRMMGKRQIGQLQPYELVVTIMISELAAIPMQDTEIPLINGIIPIFTLLFIQATFSILALKSNLFRQIVDGKPNIIIENGTLNVTELTRLRLTIDDLLEKIRSKGYANINDIAFAILETSGDLSVIPKSNKRPVTPDDLKLSTGYEGLPTILVADGILERQNLAKVNLDETWLLQELQKGGIAHWKDVFLASLDPSGTLYIQPKPQSPKQ